MAIEDKNNAVPLRTSLDKKIAQEISNPTAFSPDGQFRNLDQRQIHEGAAGSHQAGTQNAETEKKKITDKETAEQNTARNVRAVIAATNAIIMPPEQAEKQFTVINEICSATEIIFNQFREVQASIEDYWRANASQLNDMSTMADELLRQNPNDEYARSLQKVSGGMRNVLDYNTAQAAELNHQHTQTQQEIAKLEERMKEQGGLTKGDLTQLIVLKDTAQTQQLKMTRVTNQANMIQDGTKLVAKLNRPDAPISDTQKTALNNVSHDIIEHAKDGVITLNEQRAMSKDLAVINGIDNGNPFKREFASILSRSELKYETDDGKLVTGAEGVKQLLTSSFADTLDAPEGESASYAATPAEAAGTGGATAGTGGDTTKGQDLEAALKQTGSEPMTPAA